MNRKLVNGLLLVALASGGCGMFTSCKDTDDDFYSKVVLTQADIEKRLADIEGKLNDFATKDDIKDFATMEQLKNEAEQLWEELKAINEAAVSDQQKLAVLDAKVTSLEQKVNYYLANLDARLNMLITDITLQQTWNPMFGSINLPVGLSSTITANYYGVASNDVKFPGSEEIEVLNSESGLFAVGEARIAELLGDLKASDALGGEKYVELSKDDLYMSNGKTEPTSLGKLYVSINPTEVNIDDYEFSLVTSDGKAAAINVKLEESSEKLMFGVQSRSAENGFYEADIKITPEQADDEDIVIRPDKEVLKDAFKNAIKDRSKTDFATLAKVLYDQMQDIMPAYALKATWETPTTDLADAGTKEETVTTNGTGKEYEIDLTGKPGTNGQTNTVNANVSDKVDGESGKVDVFEEPDADATNKKNTYIGKYEIAVATYNPFGYKFMEDFSVSKKLPTVGSIEEAINKVFDDINIKINAITFNGEGMKIEIDLSGVTVGTSGEGLNPSKIILTYDKDNNTVKEEDGALVNVGALNGLVEKINESLSGISNQITTDIETSINSIKDSLKGKLGKLDNLVSKYNSLAKRINNFLSNPNHYLQVMMAYAGKDGQLHQLAAEKAWASPVTVGDGALDLYLTSYTAELIAPSCNKYVVVSNVWDADGNLKNEEATTLNSIEFLNQVLPGNQQKVVIDASKLKAGYTYQVLYSSLDYQGYTSTRVFYFRGVAAK